MGKFTTESGRFNVVPGDGIHFPAADSRPDRFGRQFLGAADSIVYG
jgi:hypothetical protein